MKVRKIFRLEKSYSQGRFMPDVEVTCPTCKGARYSRDTLLDEPTTGLHFADIDRLLESLNRLVDNGHSVVVIEHNLDVIKTADYVIDLGPEGGHKGGQLLACGTPEEIAASKKSYTGKFLAEFL